MNANQYAIEFRQCIASSAQAILDAASVIGRAENGLSVSEKADLRQELRLSAPTFSKWLTIAKRERLRELVGHLPPSFSSIYAVAALSDPELETLLASEKLHQDARRKDLKAWISDHRSRAPGREDSPDDSTSAVDLKFASAGTPSRVTERQTEDEISEPADELSPPDQPPRFGAAVGVAPGEGTEPYAAACTGRADGIRKSSDPWSPSLKGQGLREHAVVRVARDMDDETVARLNQRLTSCQQEFPGIEVIWSETWQRSAA